MHRHRITALIVALGLALVAMPALADVASDIDRAVRMHENGQYEGARSILLDLTDEDLSEEQRSTVEQYLLRAEQAISMQKEAASDLAAGEAAVRSGDRREARTRLTEVITNAYASATQRAAAQNALRKLDSQSSGDVVIQSNPSPTRSSSSTTTSGSSRASGTMTPVASGSTTTPVSRTPVITSSSTPTRSSNVQLASSAGGEPRLVDQLARENELLWQKAESQFRSLEKEIRLAVLDTDFAEAYRLLDVARQTVEANRRYASPASKYRTLRQQVEELEGFIQDEERQFDEEQIAIKTQEIEEAEADRINQIQTQQERQISELMERAAELRKERRFEEAIQVLEQVLAIDPNMDEAKWMLETFEDIAQHMREFRATEVHDEYFKDTIIENDESRIAYTEIMRYPQNWPDITASRKSTEELRESEETRKTKNKMRTRAPEISFDSKEFGEVIELFREMTGLNIVVNWNALEAYAIEKEVEISLDLTDVPFDKALDLILSKAGQGEVPLGYVIDEGIINISTKEDLSRNTITRVYNVQDLIISVPTFRGRNIDIGQIGQQGGQQGGLGGGSFIEGGGAGGGGGQQGGGQGIFNDGGNDDDDNDQDEGDPLQPIIDLIQQTIDPESWREAGGITGSISTLNQQLVVTQTTSNHDQLLDLLRQLRQARALQIAVEARYITITRNWLEQIGVDLDVVLNNGNAGFDQTTILNPATGNPVLVPRQFVRNGFTPGAPGGVGITLPTQPFGQPFGQPGLVPAATGSGLNSSEFTPIPLANNTLDLASPRNTNVAGTLGSLLNDQPAFQIFGSFLDNIQVDFLVRASQVDVRSSDLDAPRLVLFNGQRATFESFIEQDYIAALTPVIGDNAGAFQPRVATALTGRSLDVQATVSNDRRYVTMTVRTFTRQLGDFRTVFFGGSTTVGSGFIELATQTTQRVRTTVSVPDGGTLLIGGLKLSGERDVDAGVPILSRIPILKRAFSNTSNVKDDQVLLILIKPTIIIQEEAEADAFPSLSSLARDEF